MSWQDIMTLYKNGHQIGAHTMNHLRNLTSMSNGELNYEIGQSRQCLSLSNLWKKTEGREDWRGKQKGEDDAATSGTGRKWSRLC